MAHVLFTNVRILDGSGAQPFTGEVLVQGNRITRVSRAQSHTSQAGVTVIDGAGATLMPGMCEAHTHFAWNNASSFDDIQRMPTEEHTLWCAHVAKVYLDHGWTSCVGAATAKPRLDVVIRNAIDSGQIPGPRYLAASQEITVPGGLGDETLPHIPYPEYSFGQIVCGPEDMRRCVRMFLKYGVDSIKLNLSGDNFVPGARRDDLDERRGGRDGGPRGEGPRQACLGARAVVRVREAGAAARLRGDLPRELHRRGSPRHARGAARPHLRGARHLGADPAALRGRRRRDHAPAGEGHGLRGRAGGRREEPDARCTSAASASCPAATTASPGRRTGPMRWTCSTS